MNTAFKDNVRLAGLGLNTTWAYNLLHTVERLDPAGSAGLLTRPALHNVSIDIDHMIDCLQRRILPALYNIDSLVDPRTCPSSGVKLCTYISWFAGSSWKAYHRHITATNIPKGAHRTYMRFRLGFADTEVTNGRSIATQSRIPRAQRLCRCCNNSQVEDELHLVFECPAYTHIRERYSDIFSTTVSPDMKGCLSQSH